MRLAPRQAGVTRRAACAALGALLLAGCAVRSPRASPQDRSAVARIQSSLARGRGLRARFVQTSQGGGTSTGTAWYDPGRLRLQYDAPARMVGVASGRHRVAHRDSDDSTTRSALSANPLGLLLARPLRLSGPISVTDLQRGPGVLQVSMVRTAGPAQGLLTLIFSDRPGGLVLVGLEAVDSRRQRTRLRLIDPQAGLDLDPSLFNPPA